MYRLLGILSGIVLLLVLACPGPSGPVIESVTATPSLLHPGDSAVVACVARGDGLTYHWSAATGSLRDSTGAQTVWHAPSGIFTDTTVAVMVMVEDSAGRQDHGEVAITIDVAGLRCSPTADAYTISSSAAENTGSDTVALVGCVPASGTKLRTFIRFDVSAIPGDAVISEARLVLHRTGGEAAAVMIDVHEALVPWGEPDINWGNQPVFADPVASFTDGATTADTVSVVVTDLVRDWVNNSVGNYGLMLKRTTEDAAPGQRSYATREAGTEKAPYLEVACW